MLKCFAFLFEGGNLRKDKVNVVYVMFLIGQSFRKYVVTFINVEKANVRVASSVRSAQTSMVV